MVTAAKTTSQILVHMGIAFGVMYTFTGSLTFGGAAAILEPVCNVLVMPLHDRLWKKIGSRAVKRRQLSRTADITADIAPLP